jgi:hypothetical protein
MDGWQCATTCECGGHPKWEPLRGGPGFGRQVYFGISRDGDFSMDGSPGAWVVAACPQGVKTDGQAPMPSIVSPNTIIIRLPGVKLSSGPGGGGGSS